MDAQSKCSSNILRKSKGYQLSTASARTKSLSIIIAIIEYAYRCEYQKWKQTDMEILTFNKHRPDALLIQRNINNNLFIDIQVELDLQPENINENRVCMYVCMYSKQTNRKKEQSITCEAFG